MFIVGDFPCAASPGLPAGEQQSNFPELFRACKKAVPMEIV
jgi:hypothetical protein